MHSPANSAEITKWNHHVEGKNVNIISKANQLTMENLFTEKTNENVYLKSKEVWSR